MTGQTPRGNALLLAVVLLAIFVVPGSISGTAIALPAIAIDTGATLPGLHWVANGFNLSFACLALAWGALADGLGRKRCFLAGVAIYAAASLLSAVAPNVLVLDLGRVLAGCGASAVFSCGIALLSTHFTGAARMRVFALIGTVAGLGVSLGPTISGLLLDGLGWRAIFYAHCALLLLVLPAANAIPGDQAAADRRLNLDAIGVLLFVAALFVAMFAIVQSTQWGWQDWRIGALLALSGLLFLLLWRHERRHAAPMLDLSLLGNRPFVGYCLVTVAGSFGFVTLLTWFPTYAGAVLKMSATQAGLAMLLLTAPMLVCPLAANKLVASGVAAARVVLASLCCLLLGLAWLALASGPAVALALLAPALLLVGAGFGLAAGLVDGLALRAVPDRKAGMAAGLVNSFRLGSEAVAVSLYGALLATLLDGRLRPALAGAADGAGIERAIADAAAGNFHGAVAALPGLVDGNLQTLLANSYNGAFHDVLWLLCAVLALLTIAVHYLIRQTPCPEGPASQTPAGVGPAACTSRT